LLGTSFVRRTASSSNVSGGSVVNSIGNSSQTSSMSSESLRTQCTCSSQNSKCKRIVLRKTTTKSNQFLLAPQTPSNWKLGRILGQGIHNLYLKISVFF
jgi:hypothetical protein